MNHIKDILNDVLHNLEHKKKDLTTSVLEIWDEYADSVIKKHTKPQRYYNGYLFVLVDDASWSFEINRKYKKDIIDKINNRFEKKILKGIYFRIGDFN